MRTPHYFFGISLFLLVPSVEAAETLTLEQVKAAAATRSKYLSTHSQPASNDAPKANLKAFREEIEPALKKACYKCHGSVTAEGEFRVDTLDPDLVHGKDAEWWLEVMGVVSNREMPPEDGPKLSDDDRNRIIEWLSAEIQVASQVRRAEQGHSSFRRMTRYEYNYALQDLLGLELEFAKDLLPDPVSEDGFKNSSAMLQMSVKQYTDYLELNRSALNRATVRGERPEVLYWGVSAERASADKFSKLEGPQKASQTTGKQGDRRRGRGDRGGRGAHYKNIETGQTVPATWSFRRAVHAWTPTTTRPDVPEPSEYIAVLPAGQQLVVDLGNRLPDEGTLRVRVRAWRVSTEANIVPNLALEFGWQGSNNSKASVRISPEDLVVDASRGNPQFYQWDIPLSDI